MRLLMNGSSAPRRTIATGQRFRFAGPNRFGLDHRQWQVVGIELTLDGRKLVRVAAVDDWTESKTLSAEALLDRKLYELLDSDRPA